MIKSIKKLINKIRAYKHIIRKDLKNARFYCKKCYNVVYYNSKLFRRKGDY